MSLGLLLEYTKPLSLSEVADSGCQQMFYDALMNKCQGRAACYFTDTLSKNVACLHVCVCVFVSGVVYAPKAQRDFSPTLQIQAPCTALTSVSTVVTMKKVIAYTHEIPGFVFCIFYFIYYKSCTLYRSHFGL